MLTIVTAATLAALGGTQLSHPRPLLVWNATPSSPVGLYWVSPASRLHRGDMLVAFAPGKARELATTRGYLPYDVPLVKQIGALAGDEVCSRGADIFINGMFAARRLETDPRGRPLPRWNGCRRLARGNVFLLSAHVPGAFDGRYFGVTRRGDIVGKATLIWPLG